MHRIFAIGAGALFFVAGCAGSPSSNAEVTADASAPAREQDMSVGCTPQTCPDGCCWYGQCHIPSHDACGYSSTQCVACNTTQECINGQCIDQTPPPIRMDGSVPEQADCDSITCSGCCIGNVCYPGNSVAACGSDGNACDTCGSGQTCDDNECQTETVTPTTCNASNCAGCCVGTTCMDGDTRGACGNGGMTCSNCGADVCGGSQTCVVDPNSQWDILLNTIRVPDHDAYDDPWDYGFGDAQLADPYVEIEIGFSETHYGPSPYLENVTTGDYHGYPIASAVRAQRLAEAFSVRVYDDDTGLDWPIGGCVHDFELDTRWSDATMTSVCRPTSTTAGYELTYTLRRHM